MQHHSCPAERHIPVVSLVEVIVQPDDTPPLTVGPVALDHLAPARKPLPPVRLDKAAPIVGADDRLHDADIGDRLGLVDFGASHPAFLLQVDFGMITEQETQGTRALARATDLDVPADQGVGDPGDPIDATPLEHDGMIELGIDDLAIGGNGRERADVAVDHPGALANDGWPPYPRRDDLRVLFDHDAALDTRFGVDRTMVRRFEELEDVAVALKEGILLSGVEPPSLKDLVENAVPVVQQPLDCVGDLELSSSRRGDRRHSVMDM